MISIIVPVYNAENYLERCIKSVLRQTYEDFELILVDDGSTDSSRLLCDEYALKDGRVKSFHKLNGGANSARIVGVENALGEFVVFIDSDDYIVANALEKLVNSIDESVDIVIANTYENAIITGFEWATRLLERKIRCEMWASLYKRDILLEAFHFIPSNIVIGEDLLVNLYCSFKVDAVKLVHSDVYVYTIDNQTSLVRSYKFSLDHERRFLEIVDKIVEASGVEGMSLSLFMNKYFVLERLVYMGVNPYKEPWVKKIMSQRCMYKPSLSLKENCLLLIPNTFICRCILRIGIYIKAIIRGIRIF